MLQEPLTFSFEQPAFNMRMIDASKKIAIQRP